MDVNNPTYKGKCCKFVPHTSYGVPYNPNSNKSHCQRLLVSVLLISINLNLVMRFEIRINIKYKIPARYFGQNGCCDL